MYPPLSTVNKTERLLPTCSNFLPPAIGLFRRFPFQNRCSRANEPEPSRLGICWRFIFLFFFFFCSVSHDSAKRVTCRLPGIAFFVCDRLCSHRRTPVSFPPPRSFSLKYKTPTTRYYGTHLDCLVLPLFRTLTASLPKRARLQNMKTPHNDERRAAQVSEWRVGAGSDGMSGFSKVEVKRINYETLETSLPEAQMRGKQARRKL